MNDRLETLWYYIGSYVLLFTIMAICCPRGNEAAMVYYVLGCILFSICFGFVLHMLWKAAEYSAHIR